MTFFWIITWFLIPLLSLIQVSECQQEVSCPLANNCTSPCYCEGNFCKANTLECTSGGCSKGKPDGLMWRGPGCLVGNVAFNKKTKQSKVYGLRDADLAVDGNLCPGSSLAPPNYMESTHTHITGGHNWWYVNLGSIHVVYNVTVFNVGGPNVPAFIVNKLSNFTVYVRNSSSVAENTVCGTRRHTVPSSGATIECNTIPMVGKYVGIILDSYEFLHLCEVVVEGYKYEACNKSHYGPGCLTRCHDGCKECDDISGKCLKCQNGRFLPNCEVCHDKWYGNNCTQQCGKCINEAVCNKVNGTCTDGCEIWYFGDTCKRELESPHITNFGSPEQTFNSIIVQWEQFSHVPDGKEEHYTYMIFYKIKGADKVQTIRNTSHIPHEGNSTISINGLKPDTEYTIWIVPFRVTQDVEVAGTASQEKTFKTKMEPLPNIHGTMESLAQTSDSITIQWEQFDGVPKDAESRYKYDVMIRVNGTDEVAQGNLKHNPNKKHLTATVTKLEPNTEYTFWISPFIISSGKRINGVDSQEQIFKTKQKGEINDQTAQGKQEDTSPIGIIAGGAAGGLVVIIIICIIIVVVHRRKKKTDKAPKEFEKAGCENPAFQMSEYASVDDSFTKDGTKDFVSANNDRGLYANVEAIDRHDSEKPLVAPIMENPTENGTGDVYACVIKKDKRIKVNDLSDYIAQKKQEKDGFKKEFETLPFEELGKSVVGNLPQNKKKNKFKNLRAYDNTRVVLDKIPNDPHSDYINGSFIPGYKNIEKHYVAVQGCNQHTLGDFWRMVWQLKANRIVMLTNLIETSKVKCEPYWPMKRGEKMTLQDISILCVKSEILTNFTISMLSVSKGDKSLMVKHFHYTTWPDHGVPGYPTPLLEFHTRVRSFDKEANGPMIVHCSAGVGRTGAFINIDYNIDQARAEGVVGVKDYSCTMRKHRAHMIQTEEQYIFVYEALLEATKSGKTAISCPEFTKAFQKLCQTNNKSGLSGLEEQFQVLQTLHRKPNTSQQAGLLPKNENKNRDLNIIPADSVRPMLGGSIPGVIGGTDYINAVYVNGYEKKEAYILTQMPLPDTIPDLWRLVLNCTISSIVTLENVTEDDQNFPIYWPKKVDETLQLGSLTVTFVKAIKEDRAITIREFSVHLKNQQMTVRQFHISGWKKDSDLPHTSVILDTIAEVQKWQQKNENKPIVLQCMNGAARSGMLCAAMYVLEQLQIYREVDIFSAVKQIRVARPQVVISVEQYRFLHQLVCDFMDQTSLYANFQD